MKYSVIYITTLAILSSCTWRNEISFEIENMSKFQIDSLKIEANDNKNDEFISLKSNESKDYILDMNDIIKVDGFYNLSYKINGDKRFHNFGYYTNGAPSERFVEIKISADSASTQIN